MKSGLLQIRLLTLFAILLSLTGCASLSIEDEAHNTIGKEYYVLKFPTDKHNIGSEWSRQYNATEKGALTDDKIKTEKSLKNMDRGTSHKVALGIAALTSGGITGSAGIDAGIAKDVSMSDLRIIKPVSPGYIEFKPGRIYVGEALRLEGFSMSGKKNLSFEAKAGGGINGNTGTTATSISASDANGIKGEGLVIGYILQTVDEDSYSKKKSEPKTLTLDGARSSLGDSGIIASASYEAIVPGSGKSLPSNLLWACKKAASQKNKINAAWVVTVVMTGEERKTLKIAFPAYPEIEDCSDYQGLMSTGINSATDMIERTRLNILLQKASVSEMLEPREFSAEIFATQESFKIKTVNLQ